MRQSVCSSHIYIYIGSNREQESGNTDLLYILLLSVEEHKVFWLLFLLLHSLELYYPTFIQLTLNGKAREGGILQLPQMYSLDVNGISWRMYAYGSNLAALNTIW